MIRRRTLLGLTLFCASVTFLALSSTAAFAATQTLKVSVTGPGTVFGPGIECGHAGGACETQLEEGSALTLNAGPTERGIFHAWTGCESEPSPTECTLTVGASPAEVTAEFEEIPQQPLKVSVTGPGTVTGTSPGGEFTPIECGNGPTTCEATYNEGATVILFANHSERTAFTGWTNCPNILGPTECEVLLTTATEVEAQFTAIPQQTLTIASPGTGPGAGTITGTSPGGEFQPIDCGNGASTCTETYNEGAGPIILTATPNERSSTPIVWHGCEEEPSETECKVTLSGPLTEVEAEFTEIPQQTLTVAPNPGSGVGGGRVTGTSPGGEFRPIECGDGAELCTETYAKGTEITLTATRNERSTFKGWTGCESQPSRTECKVTLGAPTEVKAEFAPKLQEALTVPNPGAGLGGGTVTGTSPGPEFEPIACGNGSEACTETYNKDATIVLTATPTGRSTFSSWTGCEIETISSEDINGREVHRYECTVTVATATEVKASFAPIALANITLTVEGPGTVTGTADNTGRHYDPPEFAEIDCGNGAEACEAEYPQEQNDVAILTASPPPNYQVTWTGAGPRCDTGHDTRCEVSMSAAHSVKAVFTPSYSRLIVTPSGPGSVSAAAEPIAGEGAISDCRPGAATCTAFYLELSTVTLTSSPAAHDHVAWSGCSRQPGPATCEVDIGNTISRVQAAFLPNRQPLTVTSIGPGLVSADLGAISACSSFAGTCTGEYGEDSTVTLTASPQAHAHLQEWTGCKAEPEGRCEVEVGEAPAHATAVFLPTTHTLTVAPSGSGVISASSGTIGHCSQLGGACAGAYIEGNPIDLTATPEPHQAVDWQGCTHSEEDSCEVVLGASNATVQADFVPLTHTFTLDTAGSGQGSVTCNGAPCAPSYPDEAPLTLAPTPASGSTFAGWSGGGCSGTGACQLTLKADTTITATFNAKAPPAEEHCLVPSLAGKTLPQARADLTAVHCTLGTVTKPKKKKGKKLGPLVVKSSSPEAGTTLPANSKVNLKLGPKPKHKGKK